MQLVSSCNLHRGHIVSKKTTEVHQQERPQENEGAAYLPRLAFWFNPPSRLTAASEDELRLHLGELLQERVVVLEWGFAPDGVRDVIRGKSAAQLLQSARLPDHLTLIDPNRL